MQNHPIPSVTEPLQYRAIGIVRGTYKPYEIENFNRGILVDSQGCEIDSVVLGRVVTLMRRHVAIEKPHLWVVYPRCRDSNSLHLQINGIWEPSTLGESRNKSGDVQLINKTNEDINDEIQEGDNYFSIRGELVFTKPERKEIVIKIRQKPRNNNKKNLPFKIFLGGEIPLQFLRHFVNLEVRRDNQKLLIENYEIISSMPRKDKNKASKNKTINITN